MNFFSRIPTWLYLSVFSLLALGQVWLVRDTVMGDAFIHFVFARGIALGDFFSYNGVFSAGSTSPLWSLLLAPIWAFLGDGIVWGAKIFASVFVVSSIILSYFVARRISANRVISLLTSFFFATSFVLPFWAAKGMETPLFVTVVLSSFIMYFRILDLGGKGGEKFLIFNLKFLNNFQFLNFSISKRVCLEILLGVLLGLGIFARPEGWFLAAFLGLGLLAWQRSLRPLFTVGIPAVFIFAPYYLLLFAETGQFLPSSAARVLHATQWLSHSFFGMPVSFEIVKILVTKFALLTPFFLLFLWGYFVDRPFSQSLPRGEEGGLGALTQKFLVALGMTREADTRFIFWPIFAWLAFHLVFFSTIMPMTQGYRYLLAVMPFFIVLALIGLWRLSHRGAFGMLVIVVVGGWLSVSTQQLLDRRAAIASCEVPYIDAVRAETGEWLRENAAPDDVIAIKEVDQSAYFSGRKVLSMDGTLNLAAVPFVRNHDQLGYIKTFRPDWLILEEEMYNYPGWRDSNLHPLIDPTLAIGASKELGGLQFTLAHKLSVGTKNDCAHFVGGKSADEPYFWYFYRIDR